MGLNVPLPLPFDAWSERWTAGSPKSLRDSTTANRPPQSHSGKDTGEFQRCETAKVESRTANGFAVLGRNSRDPCAVLRVRPVCSRPSAAPARARFRRPHLARRNGRSESSTTSVRTRPPASSLAASAHALTTRAQAAAQLRAQGAVRHARQHGCPPTRVGSIAHALREMSLRWYP